MRVISGIASAVLILEFSLSAIANLSVMQVSIDRWSALTRTSPSKEFMFAMGLLDLLGVVGVVVGFWQPKPAIVAGAFFALLSAFVLFRQVGGGDRLGALLPYALFLSAAVVTVATRLAQE